MTAALAGMNDEVSMAGDITAEHLRFMNMTPPAASMTFFGGSAILLGPVLDDDDD